MAILSQNAGGQIRSYEVQKLCPEGVYPARCIDIMDSFGVEEPSYDDPSVKVKKDKTRFLFSVKTANGVELVQTFEFNISGAPKSNLVAFIRTWLGKAPPPAFDTNNLIGEVCQLSIANRTSKKGTAYAAVGSIAPLMDPSQAPAADAIEIPGGPRASVIMDAKGGVHETMSSGHGEAPTSDGQGGVHVGTVVVSKPSSPEDAGNGSTSGKDPF